MALQELDLQLGGSTGSGARAFAPGKWTKDSQGAEGEQAGFSAHIGAPLTHGNMKSEESQDPRRSAKQAVALPG